MGKLKVEFHPIFILFSFLIVYFGWFYQFLIYFLVLCLHEFAHYFVAKRLGYVLNKVVFMPYGAGLGGKNQIILPKHEIAIALAGPLFNMILVLLTIVVWWVYPLSYAYTDIFVMANLSLGVFNLLPLFPLDGGRVLVCLLSNKIKRQKVYVIMKIMGIIGSVIFAILFVLSVFTKVNLTFFFISLFLFTSCFGNDVNVYFERTHIVNFSKNITSPVPIQHYVVDKNTPLYKMVKYLKSGYYVVFYVMDNNKIVKVVTEQEILKMIENNNIETMTIDRYKNKQT